MLYQQIRTAINPNQTNFLKKLNNILFLVLLKLFKDLDHTLIIALLLHFLLIHITSDLTLLTINPHFVLRIQMDTTLMFFSDLLHTRFLDLLLLDLVVFHIYKITTLLDLLFKIYSYLLNYVRLICKYYLHFAGMAVAVHIIAVHHHTNIHYIPLLKVIFNTVPTILVTLVY